MLTVLRSTDKMQWHRGKEGGATARRPSPLN